ncbi:hypothetical protein FOYG_05876 [Fusarium oxysporum NRRL 32931]|uniref:Alcohol dehydrogenase-like C-terminal domain-containing protein n=1 Tax=Fusarium oxysporum NRRL 32931 TaxID=660029 RepID=W9IBI7_FUSOX|nr:hypothetical protein FOYG_05876 [Fusarium oxysporum NRRL 32931]
MTTNIPGPALYADNEGNVLVRRDLPAPTPAEGEILIEVLFSGYTSYEDDQPLLPANLLLPDAAALTTVVQTANDALFHLFKLPLPSSGHGHIEGTLVVWGGGTAVGMSAIQLARAVGLTSIIVTASASRHRVLREFGATQCFDYHDESVFGDLIQRVDLIRCVS